MAEPGHLAPGMAMVTKRLDHAIIDEKGGSHPFDHVPQLLTISDVES